MKKIALVLSLGATMLTAGCGHPAYEVQNFGKWFGDKITNDGGYEVATRDAFVLKPPAAAPQAPELQTLPGTAMSSDTPPPVEAGYQDLWEEPVDGMSPGPESEPIAAVVTPERPPAREMGRVTAPVPQSIQAVVLEPAPEEAGLSPWPVPQQLPPQQAPRPSLVVTESPQRPEPDYYPPLVPVRQRTPELYNDGTESYGGGSVTVFSLDDMPDTRRMRPVNDTRAGTYHVGGGYDTAQYDGSSVTVNRYPDIFGDEAFAPVAGYGTAGTAPYDTPKLIATHIDNALYFNYGSSRIDDNDHRLIREFARAAVGRMVHVSGHASHAVFSTNDPGERRAINLQMSAKRAEAVAEVLQDEGIPAEKIRTVAHGEIYSSDEGDNPKDRRVELKTN